MGTFDTLRGHAYRGTTAPHGMVETGSVVTMTDRERRESAFALMCENFSCRKPSSLISAHAIDADLFHTLQIKVASYIAKCLPIKRPILAEAELLQAIEAHRSEIPNMTPNGMMVPKRHTILEYNAVVQAFAAIMKSLSIERFISSWHIPLNVRVKYGLADEDNLKRHHPTEDIHSDSWAGESAESVTTMIQIFGDIERNHVRFFHPPEDFREDFLGPRPSYRDGAEIAKRFHPVDYTPAKGELILSDFASLHCSHRLPDAGPRISIDTTFALRKFDGAERKEVMHAWRAEERTSHAVLSKIGEEHIFACPHGNDEHVDSQGGFKHPTKLELVRILPESTHAKDLPASRR